MGTAFRDYVHQTVNRLLTSLVFALRQAAREKDAESVHKLRVASRRFSQSLIVFGDFLPPEEVKKIRKQLKKLMRISSEVRNRDIALEYLAARGEPAYGVLEQRLANERKAYEEEFSALLAQWRQREFSAHWRSALAPR